MREKSSRNREARAGASRVRSAAKAGRRVAADSETSRRPRRPPAPPKAVATRDSERTTAQILDAAIGLIESEGESGVRVHQLARKAGRTMGAVYHHFESREGVIEAARAMQFRGQTDTDLEAMRNALERCRRPEDVVGALVDILRTAVSPGRREVRWTRVDVVGCARARPRLAEVLGAEQHQIVEAVAEVFRAARDRGLLRRDVDVESLALLAQQVVFAFVLVDIDSSSPVDADRYARFFGDFVRSLLPDRPGPRRRGA